MKITEQASPGGQSGVRYSSVGTRDVLASVEAVTSRHVLLQYLRGNPEDARDGDPKLATVSYLLDAATGRGALLDETLPLIVVADPDRQVAMWPLPYPRLELRTAVPPSTSE